MGPTTRKKQSPPTAYELTNDWTTTKTKRSVGLLEKMMSKPLMIK
jgi:hypothetical protein